METMQFGAVLLLCFTGCAVAFSKPTQADVPTWGSTYMVMATLHLPYAEIVEPLMTYYDATNKRSRTDYYGGMVKTLQRADVNSYGVSFKIAPITTYKVKNQMSCFQHNGSKNRTVQIQGILPNLTGFTNIDVGIFLNQPCQIWQLVDMKGTKKNVYTMWVNNGTQAPVRYEMMGYDTLLGSHFDKYLVDYSNFQMNINISKSIFDVTENLTCGNFPGPGGAQKIVLMNPLHEYINNNDDHLTEAFDQFKITNNRSYKDNREHGTRLHVFRHNLRFIHSTNRAGKTYSVAVNHLADKLPQELKMMRGYHYSLGSHGGLPFDKSKYDINDLPNQMNWRLFGAVTPVKDQAACGSCWSFGTTGTIEGSYFLKTGMLVTLSQQELMDCSWGEGNNGCNGGEDFRAYNWIMKSGGLTTQEQYGQYLAVDGYCHNDSVQAVAKIKNYVNVTSGDQDALKIAIVKQGPISVSIDASHKSLWFYANGVYYEPTCGNKPDDLDHSVLAVGYGVLNGEAYWLIKNSWSTYWGNDGYVLMSQRGNNCGVATNPTFVVM